jgi:hypothetical protein
MPAESAIVTSDEIDSMPAGPEMDRLVAERVIQLTECDEWRLQHITEMGPIYFHDLPLTSAEHLGGCRPKGWTPPYSTSDAAALEIVKKIPMILVPVLMWKSFEKWNHGEGRHDEVWWIAEADETYIRSSAIGDPQAYIDLETSWDSGEICATLALAICRAALKARLPTDTPARS